MLYSRRQLRSPNFNYQTAMSRYLNKYLNQKSEFKRLKAHEKDYVFEWANHILDNKGNPIINLYEEPLACEYLFYRIILTYGEDVDSFKGRFTDHKGVIPENQVQKDKSFFDNCLIHWKRMIDEHKGPYLSIIEPLLKRKLVELKKACKSEEEYNSREKYCLAVFFYLYYKAKVYFDELNPKALIFTLKDYTFVANIYTFCHIFTRHYVPSLNRGIDGNSMNDDLPCIDINNFLESIQNLIASYFSICDELDSSKEYLLFKLNNDPYILWIKYKRLDELSKNYGFEIRSFYKCEAENDLIRFIDTHDVPIGKDIVCCI